MKTIKYMYAAYVVSGISIVGMLYACTPAQIAATQVQGQLFCAKATPTVPLVVALADAAGGPISVIGLAASTVAAACAAWTPGAVPVTPPPIPSAAPLVAAPIAPAAVKAGA